MINVYEIGTTLKLVDLVTPHLLKLSEHFSKLDAVTLQVNKRLQKMGAEVAGIRNLSTAAKSLSGSLKIIKDEAALAEKNLIGLRVALPAGGLGLEAELIAANAQARTLAATLAGIRGIGRVPGGGGALPGAGGGGRHGGGVHGGNMHMGTNGVGIGGVGIGLASDALVPIGAALVAGYVGKQFYESSKTYQDEFMRFKSLNLGDKVNTEADSFVKAAHTYGVSQSELMKAMAESVGLFGSFEEASKYTPALVTLGKANNAIYGDKLGAMDDAGLKNLLKFIDRRGGFKNEASFNKNLNLAEQLVTGSGGFLHFQDLGAFSQHGGTAFRGLSDEGLLRMEGLMIEQGGAKAGTAMMSIYQNLVAGRTPKKTMQLLQSLGIGHITQRETGSVGGRKSTSSTFDLLPAYSAMVQADPAKFFGEVVPKLLAKKGITSEAAVLKAVNDMLSNRNASNQGSIMTAQQFQVIRDFKLASGSMGSDQVTSMFKKSASGAEADFDAAWIDFKKQFGAAMLPQITSMLKTGADMLRTLAAMTDTPAFKAMQSFGSSAAHAFAWPYRLMFGSANAAESSGGAGGSPYVQPKQQAIQLTSTINIDGKKIGEAATDYIIAGFNRAQSTNSGFDMTRSAPPIGLNYAR